MTTPIMQVTPFAELAAPTLKTAYLRFLRVLDAIAEAKIRDAVRKWQLRRLCKLFLVFAVLAAVAGGIIALKAAIWIVPFIR